MAQEVSGKDFKLYAQHIQIVLLKKEMFNPTIYIIFQAEKVHFIANIKDIPVKSARNAEMALLCGNPSDAESILLQAGLIFRAVMLNMQLYNWDR